MSKIYDNPWINKETRKQQAQRHTMMMEQTYSHEIKQSVEDTHIYDDSNISFQCGYKRFSDCLIHVINMTSTEAVIDSVKRYPQNKVAVLNFASYKNPGGMFMNGSIAQEEALCHDSFLYNVLKEFKKTYYDINCMHKNKALYTNKALYSKDIYFFDSSGKYYPADVITCAAPNFSAASKYMSVTREENRKVLEERTDFVFQIAIKEKVDCLILGAWGCGVFGQDPIEVASIFQKYLEKYKGYFKEVIFAVPQSKNHNYEMFTEIFNQ